MSFKIKTQNYHEYYYTIYLTDILIKKHMLRNLLNIKYKYRGIQNKMLILLALLFPTNHN